MPSAKARTKSSPLEPDNGVETAVAQDLRGLRSDPRRAIQGGGIVCLLCGGVFSQLTNTHFQSHGMTTLDYKRRFGYNLRRPLMCEALLRLYRERAIRVGLAARIRQRPIVTDPELRRRGGFRPIALEELLARREAWRKRKASADGKNDGGTPTPNRNGQPRRSRAPAEAIRTQTP